ncbi:TPA: helix-turn-helix domain-containing protein [Enterobacter hormaechei subsp. steigerwaltii]|nr:helix-turn-helix domain-containing protein [Enterobacter hormaechei subsp. steigerwaltii]
MARVTVDTAAIARSQAEGKTQQQTADALGISLTAVRYHWIKGESGNKRGSAYAAKIAELVAEGKTDRQIAELLGVAISTANRHRRALKG